MLHLKAPEKFDFDDEETVNIFLAGSIEMGNAEPWQERLVEKFKDANCVFFNPRRTDWDSSWVQDPTPGTKFHEQVTWELDHINYADLVVFYFDPNTQSPITLLELGYVLGADIPLIVCCPDGYFRKGNVVITSKMCGVSVLNTFDELIDELTQHINDFYVDIY
jgi:nucleoside 2-deoxyribosyltransferase